LGLFQAVPGTREADELELLLVLIKDYEDKHIFLPEIDPIEAIKLKMEERGMRPKTWSLRSGQRGMFPRFFRGAESLLYRWLKN
jgi:HTH-type transcriptional regulator / antitoxin HigA